MTPRSFDGDGEPSSLRLVHDVGAWVRDLERRARERDVEVGRDAESRAETAERRTKHANAATRAALVRAQEAEARARALVDELREATERADKAEAWLKIAHGCLQEMARQKGAELGDGGSMTEILAREGLG